MAVAYLIIGGNLGDRSQNLAHALHQIEAHAGKVLACSSVYQTAAWGKEDQPDFLNQVLQLETTLSAESLMEVLLHIELEMGRIRDVKNGPRTMDMDILLYDDLILNQPQLHLPHPRMHLRRFVLEPLAELAPETIHPVEKRTIAQLLQACTDPLDVKKIAIGCQ